MSKPLALFACLVLLPLAGCDTAEEPAVLTSDPALLVGKWSLASVTTTSEDGTKSTETPGSQELSEVRYVWFDADGSYSERYAYSLPEGSYSGGGSSSRSGTYSVRSDTVYVSAIFFVSAAGDSVRVEENYGSFRVNDRRLVLSGGSRVEEYERIY